MPSITGSKLRGNILLTAEADARSGPKRATAMSAKDVMRNIMTVFAV